jgi:Spy/CpxP family protein refolding chaperone
MKSIIKTGIVGAIAAVFVASVAIAGGQQAGGAGQRGRGPGGPGGPMGPGGRGGALGIVMQDLTAEQREQVRTIMEEQREQGPPAEMKLRHDLQAELFADSPNDAKIEELRQQLVAASGDALNRQIATEKRIAQILTAEQRAKVRERLAQGPGERGRRGQH